MTRGPHLDRQYEQDLAEITDLLLTMGARAADLVGAAVGALQERDPVRARQVMERDQSIDDAELRCDELCMRAMARWAPVGADLRLVMSALKVVTDIERIGDMGVNIAKRSIELDEAQPLDVPELAKLASRVLDELGHALQALKARDSAMARQVRGEDHAADELNRAAFSRLIQIAKDEPDRLESVLAATSVSRYLERVGDHAVNIAESVVYLVEGKVLRHREA